MSKYLVQWDDQDNPHIVSGERIFALIERWNRQISTYGGDITGSLEEGRLTYQPGYAAGVCAVRRDETEGP